MTFEMRRPLFKYFGSKWRLSKQYSPPKYPVIFEPFAGGAAYSLHYHEREVVLCELNARIANLWQWLITAPSDTIANLPTFDGQEGLDLFEWASGSGVPWQAAELVIRWQRTGTNDCSTVSKWNGESGLWKAATRDYIAEAVQHIKHWRVYHGSYSDIVPTSRWDVTCFVDPPYHSHKPTVYRNTKSIDYVALRRWCELPHWAHIIVCESAGASWLPFVEMAEIKNARTGHENGKRSIEMVYER